MSWDDFVQSLTYDEESMGEEAWQQYLEQLEWLHSHPMDINSATPDEMAMLPFLTPAQIEAIQAYVHLDGPMKSLGELALIPAIDYQTRRVLPLFFTVRHGEGRKSKKGSWFRNMQNSLDSRMDIPLYYRKGYQTGKYRGNPMYNRIRYSLESDHVNIGAHAKKDPGEGFYDSFGGYAMIRNKGIVRTAIIGDYRAGWGEGLVISRGTSTGKSSMMSNTSQGIRPMTGMSESGFLRGVAITLGKVGDPGRQAKFRMSGTLFASYRALDATLDEDGNARTIVESGYHRTESEIAKKNNTRSALVGAHILAEMGHFSVGATGYWQHFNRTLSPGNDQYRRWYPQGQDFGVIGLHGGYSYYRWTASAEVAYSTVHGGIATLGRVQWLANRNLKIGVLGRYYDHKFYSFLAAAICENSRVQNESGAMLRIEARPWDRLSLIAYADFFADYWPRYGMTKSSNGQELMLEGKFEVSGKHSLSLRYQMKRKAANDLILARHRMKAQWTCLPSGKWKLQSTALVHMAPTKEPGFGFSQLIQGRMLKEDALRLGLMAGYFHAPDYLTRIYIYEPSLWNSTSSTSYYGHGLRFATTIRYTFPRSHWMIEAKYALTHMLDRSSISSGLQEILSPTRQDISVQLRMTY
ncbi:MAG: helix-hairpin-helix domain-containing protein [Bacteroidaceae bacterium]|nr:helix-hairpin-helix domain-containing protein [Bacteroidaceae bacterium]